MMRRIITHLLLFVLAMGWAFYFYNLVRAMRESVGFGLGDLLKNALATGLFCVPLLMLVLMGCAWLRRFRGKPAEMGWVVGVFLAAVSAGSVFGEAWMLTDERAFLQEVKEAGRSQYSRDRCWPNAGTALVYQAPAGLHATD